MDPSRKRGNAAAKTSTGMAPGQQGVDLQLEHADVHSGSHAQRPDADNPAEAVAEKPKLRQLRARMAARHAARKSSFSPERAGVSGDDVTGTDGAAENDDEIGMVSLTAAAPGRTREGLVQVASSSFAPEGARPKPRSACCLKKFAERCGDLI